MDNESRAEGKRQTICAVDDEEEERKANSMGDGSLVVNNVGLHDMAVVDLGKHFLSAKCLCCPDSRDNLFSETTTLRDVLEGEPAPR